MNTVNQVSGLPFASVGTGEVRRLNRRRRLRQLAVLVATASWTTLAGAGPEGGTVTHGDGQIGRAGNGTTLITQRTDRMSIDWRSFNVGANERVVFQQPSSTSTALNRIFDQNASQIFGAIDANGRILLLNPNGILFGESAKLNIQSLVASSLELSLDDFKAGNYNLRALADSRGGAIINRGVIKAASGGSVSLIGDSVLNEGLILADYGQVNLAAGRQATLDFDGDGVLLFAVDAPVLENAEGVASAVANRGQILADGGQVLLAANTARDVFTSVVNNEGNIRALRIDDTGGVIRLVGSGGTVRHSGTIDASSVTGAGGVVQMTGDRIGVFGSGSVNASGRDGGGVINVGGGLQGGDATLANAQRTYVGPDTTLRADATQRGDGGELVVWSDVGTQVYGNLSARGGAAGGDGGFIETSGKYGLVVTAAPDVSAARGSGGTWLIDPANIDIIAGGAGVTTGFDLIGPPPAPPAPFVTDGTASPATLGVDLILSALTGGASVSVITSAAGVGAGDITWDALATLDYDGTGTNSLTLTALRDITLNGSILDSTPGLDTLNLTLDALGDVIVNSTAAIDLGVSGVFATTPQIVNFSNNGSITAPGGIDIFLTGTFNNGGAATLDAGSDAVEIDAVGPTLGGASSVGGTITGTGNFYLAGDAVDVISVDAAVAMNIDAGGGDDQIVLNADLTGTADGGAGNDTIGLSGGSATAYAGNAGNDTLLGDSGSSLWTVTAISGGSLDGAPFTGVENLFGGSLAETFGIDPGIVLLGSINGGGGDDIFNVGDGGGATGLFGDAGDDLFDFAGSFAGTLSGGADADTADFADLAGVLAVDLSGADFAADDIESVVGNGASGTLLSGTGDDAWTLDGLGGGTVLVGGTSTVVAFSGFDAGLDAGTGTDTLAGPDSAVNWAVTATDTLAITGVNIGIVGVEQVSGGTDVDTFDIDFDFTGDLDGGAGADVFNLNNASAVTGELIGGAGNDTFNLSAGSSVSVSATGDEGDDVFAFAGAFSSAVVGGIDNDTADYSSAAGALSIDLTAAMFAADDIENFIGNSDVGSTLLSGAGDDAWTLTTSGGTVLAGGASTTVTFQDFPNQDAGLGANTLQGPDQDTTWTISAVNTITNPFTGGDVTGIGAFTGGTGVDTIDIDFAFTGDLDGGAGADILNLNAGTVTGNVFGGGGTDTITVTSGSATLIDGGTEADELVGDDVSNTWNVTALNEGDLNGQAFINVENLTGGALDDTFDLTDALTGTAAGGGDVDVFIERAGGSAAAYAGDAGDDLFDIRTAGSTTTLIGGADLDEATFANVAGPLAVDLSAARFAMDDIESVVGNGPTSTLLSGAGDDTWTLDGSGGGTVIVGANLTAIDFTGFDAGLDAGAGDDSLTGPDQDLTWTVTAVDTLTVPFATGGIVGIDQFIGGAGIDTFDIDFDYAGDLNGGAGNDIFNLNNASTVTGSLIGGTEDDAFNLSAGSSVSVAATGGAGADLFDLAGAFASTIVGGAGADTVDFADVAGALAVDLSAAVYASDDIELFIGNNLASSTLLSGLGDDAWSLTATGGTVLIGGATTTVTFQDFPNQDAGAGADTLQGPDQDLTWTIAAADVIANPFTGGSVSGIGVFTGGSGVDTVNIGADFTGDLGGGAGADFLNLNAGTVTGNVLGGGGDDTITVASGSATLIDGGTEADALVGDDIPNFWTVATPNTGDLNGQAFANVENLTGGTDTDQFDFISTLSGTAAGNAGADQFFHLGGSAGNIDGGVDADIDTVYGAAAPNAFVVNAPDAGTLNGNPFSGIEELIGNIDVDTFDLMAALSGSVDGDDGDDVIALTGGGSALSYEGGLGNDELIGADTVNTWAMTALDTGTLNAVVFSNIENLTGGALADTFDIAFALSGDVAGGAGADGVTLAAAVTGNVLGDGGIDTINMAGGSATLIDGGTEADELVGADAPNLWTVATPNTGDLNGQAFANVENLTGGTDTDQFDFISTLSGTAAGNAGADQFFHLGGSAGNIDGGVDADIDTVYGAATPNAFVVNAPDAGTLNGNPFSGIEELIGNIDVDTFDLMAALSGSVDGDDGDDVIALTGGGSALSYEGGLGNDELIGADTLNTWAMTALDTGTLNTVVFSNIENLTGGALADTFDIAFALSGDVAGGAGADGVTLAAAVTGNVLGDGGIDTINMAGGSATLIDGGTEADELVGADAPNLWTVATPNTGDLNGQAFANVENLTGGTDTDQFDFVSTLSGTAAGNAGADQFFHLGGSAGNIDGGVDADIDAVYGAATPNAFVVNAPDAGTLNGNPFSGIEDLIGNIDVDTFALMAALSGIVDGDDGDDVIALTGGGSALSYEGGLGNDELIGADTLNTWAMTALDTGTLNTVVFSNIENLTGGALADTFDIAFALSGDVAGGAGADGVTLAAAVTGNVLGDGGIDTINMAGGSATLIDGGTEADELVGADAPNLWTVATPNTGDLNGQAFANVENLTGGTDTDQFDFVSTLSGTAAGNAGADQFFHLGGSAGNIDGGVDADIDAVYGAATPNAFVVNAPDAGTLNGNPFSGIEDLIGNIDVDTFALMAALSGIVDGDDGDDVIALTGGGSALSYEGGLGTDELIGADVLNNWAVTSLDTGTLNTVAFSNIEDLTGGALADTFDFTAALTGTASGGGDNDVFVEQLGGSATAFDGGAGDDLFDIRVPGSLTKLVGGADNDTATFANVAGLVDVDLSAPRFADFDIENVIGNGVDGTLLSGAGDDIWQLDTLGNGVLVTPAGSPTAIAFSGFGTLDAGLGTDFLQGPDGVDQTWTVDAAGNLQVPFLIQTQIDSIEEFLGGDGIDTFAIDFDYAGNLSGGPGNDIFNIVGSVTGNLSGNDGDDTFNLLGGSAVLIDGGDTLADTSLADTIVGQSLATAWNVTAPNAGDVDGQAFANIENLTGGSAVDTFTFMSTLAGTAAGSEGADQFFHAGGSAGLIDGGLDSDTVYGDALANAFVVNAADAGTLNGAAFAGVENLVGNTVADTFDLTATLSGQVDGDDGDDVITLTGGGSAGSFDGNLGNDTLVGADLANAWAVTMADAGTLNGSAFAGIENLTGGALADTFDIGAALTGTVAGLGGDDAYNLSGGSAGLIDGAGATADNDTLTGANVANAWTVSATNAGDVNGQMFSAVENLVGGTASDAFAINAAVTGNVAGGDGADTFTLSADPTITVAGTVLGGAGADTLATTITDGVRLITYDGGLGTDTLSLDGGAAGYLGVFDSSAATLAYTSSGGMTQTAAFSNLELIQDTVIADTLQFNAAGSASVTLSAGTTAGLDPLLAAVNCMVDFSNKTNLDLDAPGVAVTLTGALGISGMLDIQSASLSSDGGLVTANDLIIRDAQIMSALNTAIQTLMLTGASGTFSIADEGDLELLASDVTGDMTVAAAGTLNVAASETVTSTSGLTLTSTGGALTIGGNVSSAAVNLNAMDLQLTGNVAGTSSVGLNSGGAVTQTAGTIDTAALTSMSTSGLDLSGINAMRSVNATNTGGAMRVTNSSTSTMTLNNSGGAMNVNNGGGLTLAGLTNSGGTTNVTASSLNVAGGVTTTGGAATTLNASGAVTQNAAVTTDGDVTLSGGTIVASNSSRTTSNNGGVTYSGNGNITVNDVNATNGTVVLTSATGDILAARPESAITSDNISFLSSFAVGKQESPFAVFGSNGTLNLEDPNNLGTGIDLFINEFGLFVRTGSRAFNAIDQRFLSSSSAFGQSQSATLSTGTAIDPSTFAEDVEVIGSVGRGVTIPCGQVVDEEEACQ